MMRLLSRFVLLALVAGCAHGVDDGVGESAPQIVEHSAPAPNLPIPGGTSIETPTPETKSSPQPFVCRAGSLCEDFEGAPASWHVAVGTLTAISDSASPGSGAVRVQGTTTGDAAYLAYDRESTLGTHWAGTFSSTLKFGTLGAPARGPSLHVVRDDGIVVDVSLSLRPDGLYLEQETTACPETMEFCGARTDLVAEAPPLGAWTKLAIGIEIGGNPTLGRVSLRVNDGDEVVRPLDVPLTDGHLAYRAGLVSTGASTVSFDMDDVWLFVLP